MSDPARDQLFRDHAATYRAYFTAMTLCGQTAADALGQNPTDFHALNVLEFSGPLTTGALAARIGLSQSATTRLVDRLERNGWAHRAPDPADRRRVVVEAVPLTPQQQERTLGPVRRRLAEVLDTFDTAELGVLYRYFEAAAPALREAATRTREAARETGRDGAGETARDAAGGTAEESGRTR
ncbi:MarR family winged helix-turn-helix transcriptional regulator [Streptomyces sp. NPDC004111]|uniref:MarR family winged helix-turn-helix transcriptional regulator n=1 Tax=Streptomyces sp. NPDC004111 TaxID=3364690 RepID=UPI0036B9E084